ncbi:MAG TPA: GDYXXLXY domain-containing protein [Herpetosiphonaceae bacterium]
MKAQLIACWATLALIIGVTTWQAAGRERLAREGTLVFLELAPADPRSLMQGDYMSLRYDLAGPLSPDQLQTSGWLVIRLDERQVARFVRVHAADAPLAAGELLLRYRVRGYEVWIGSDSFFFQEGQAPVYARARYAELRLDADGSTLLVGLRDGDLKRLGE